MIRAKFVDADIAAPAGMDLLPTKIHQILGNDPTTWSANGRAYEEIRYRNLYQGINLVFGAEDAHVAYRVELAPGASIGQMQWRYEGHESIEITPQGEIAMETAGGRLTWDRPSAYWLDGDQRRSVAVSYRLEGDVVGFRVADYPRDRPLIIDPRLTVVSYLGGSANDTAAASSSFVVAPSGDILVALWTGSVDLQATAGALSSSSSGVTDIFLVRLDPTASIVRFATYLGGSADDLSNSLALTVAEEPVMTGQTVSSNFPTTGGSLRTTGPRGTSDAIVARLSADGSALLAGTYLGGFGAEIGTGLTILPDGKIFAVGITDSTSGFPVTGGARQTSFGGGSTDNYLVALNGSLQLVYGSYLGGNGEEYSNTGVLTGGTSLYGPQATNDRAGNVTIGGLTTSTNFPTTLGAYSTSIQGDFDGFVVRLRTGDFFLLGSTLLGGTNFDAVTGVAVDELGRIVTVGDTASANFPTLVSAPQPSYQGGLVDAFASSLTTDLTTLRFSTFVGGSSSDQAGVRVAVVGDLIELAGHTQSSNLPVSPDAAKLMISGATDAYLAIIDTRASSFNYMTYLGAAADDVAISVVRDLHGSLVVVGATNSTSLPTTSGVIQPTYGGGAADAFLAKFQTGVPKRVGAYNSSNIWLLDVDGDGQFTGGVDRSFPFGFAGAKTFVADFNGDGRDELALYNQGFWFIDYNGDTVFDGGVKDKLFAFGFAGATPVIGDWNGDGKVEVGVYNLGFWFLDYNGDFVFNGAPTDKQYAYGFAGVTPYVGDWNGDGKDNAGFYKDGFWFLDANGNELFDGSPVDVILGLGGPGVTPVVGDWDGDGADSVGFYNLGFWFLDYDGNAAWDGGVKDKVYPFGYAGATPLVGDWNGDGRVDVGVFDNGAWFLDANGSATYDGSPKDSIFLWGGSGSTPVIGSW